MGSRLGIDLGDFSNTVPLRPDQTSNLVQAGVGFAIHEFTFPEHVDGNIQALAQGNLDRALYNFFYWRKTDAEILTTSPSSVRNCIDAAARLQAAGTPLGWWRPDKTFVPQLWWDCEADAGYDNLPTVNPDSPERVIQLVATAIEWARFEGLASGVYTNSWWVKYTGNSNAFANIPLWFASQFQTTTPLPMDIYFQKYGYGLDKAWPVPMLWQHRGTGIAGVDADQNLEEWADVPA